MRNWRSAFHSQSCPGDRHPGRSAASRDAATTSATPAVHRIASDDELLDALADQGPMLVTATDGQRYLVLTRPN